MGQAMCGAGYATFAIGPWPLDGNPVNRSFNLCPAHCFSATALLPLRHARPILAGGAAQAPVEVATEMALIAETKPSGNLGNGFVRFLQQFYRVGNANMIKITDQGHSRGFLEDPPKHCFAHATKSRRTAERNPIGVILPHPVENRF